MRNGYSVVMRKKHIYKMDEYVCKKGYILQTADNVKQ